MNPALGHVITGTLDFNTQPLPAGKVGNILAQALHSAHAVANVADILFI